MLATAGAAISARLLSMDEIGRSGSTGRDVVVTIVAAMAIAHLGVLVLAARAFRRLDRQATAYQLRATHDALTGLGNRRQLDEWLTHAVRNVGDGGAVALAVVGLDRFRVVNDTLGHECGDQILRTVALRLVAVATALDTSVQVARVGGDEFALLATGEAGEARAAIERTLTAVDAPIDVSGLDISVTASTGLALSPFDGAEPSTLLRRAGIAMHVAKQRHRRLHRYEPADDRFEPEQFALAADIRRALASDELFVVYQPKVHLRTGAFTGVEALVRWRHPVLGELTPERFIPLVENSDLIGPFTAHVLDRILDQQAQWAGSGHHIPIAMNVSARNLADADLVEHVTRAIESGRLDPHMIEFELTESAVVDDTGLATLELGDLRELGVRIALDDFGTGYASIRNLTGLPIDVVKVDRAFVKHVLFDRASRAVVSFSVDLADQLGLEVVAEGVEDQATLSRLRELGCDVAQGYHISRPLDADTMIEWLDDFGSHDRQIA